MVCHVRRYPFDFVSGHLWALSSAGKTSVRKVLFETNFNPNEDPTHVAYIESSLAPVRLKQRRGWKLSRTADKDAENVRQALEDYITVKIFQYMRKKRIAQRADNGTLESTPSSTGSNMHSTESGHRRSSAALPISEGVHTDYLVVDIPAPKLDRAMTGSPDSTSLLFQPQDYTSYDMSATFSEKLQEAVPLSQLQNIFKWWPKRNSIKDLPPLEPVTGIQSCYSKPPLQASDCFMSVSEFCGEPSLICLLPLMFSPNWVYLLTYNLQLSPDKPVESWKRASITTCDGDVLSNTGVLVEWMCTAIATAGVRNELYVPVTLSSDHSHLPVMLLVGTNTCNSDASTSLDVCKHIKALVPSAGVHFNQLEAAQTRKEVVMVKVSCNLEEERRQEQYGGFSHLRRELELNACRNMCTFAQNIPLIWTAVYLHLKHVQKDRKKSFIFLHQLQHNLREESQVSVEVPTLQVALKYFHSLGLLCYFHQHQQLKEIVFLQPQAFLEALSSIMVLHRNWSVEKKNADYIECLKSGIMKRNLLFLIYDSGKHLLDFNVCLFVLDALNILCIHPILNSNPQKPCYIVPCLVQSTYRNGFFPSQANEDETEWLMFEAEGMPFPWAVYNQLVTCCSRAFVTFLPKLWQGVSHFQLTNYLHLVLVHDTSSIVFRVERNSSQCESCITLPETDEQRPPGSVCSQCKKPCEPHMLGQGISPLCSECGVLPTGPTAADSGVCYVEWKGTIKTGLTADELPNVLNKVKKSSNSCSQCVHSLSFPVHERALSSVCPDTLRFLCSQLACVKDCWFPGLRYTLKTKHWKGSVQCDKKWRNSVVMEDLPAGLRCWWK